MSSNKSYRIKYDTNNSIDHLTLKINQDFDFLEVLSLKISQEDVYKLYTSDYGVLVGRVLANDGFGIPNAKVSIFIKNNEINETDNESIIYPYKNTSDKNYDNIRYNLLPSNKVSKCHQNVGSFPIKRNLLDNDQHIDVFNKYYKYTTVTNESGDYMIFGVPVGTQQIHVDVDLSDIGILSQTPRDMEYKGYSLNQFDSPNKFKKSTNLDSLSQIISENTTVFIYPFWGDSDEGEIAISKKNINLQYKFEPTCVFIGSMFSDSEKNGISKTCKPSKTAGKMSEMMSSQGTIEMIRKTIDDEVEQFDISGNRLINNDGVWCYQIPMNLDYVITDEYGNIQPTDDINKGIPTKACVRFRLTLDNNGDEFVQSKIGSYLIPNNPKTQGEEDYEFGSACKETSFVTLMWNKVYSVKNYIPRIQKNKNGIIQGIGTEAKTRNFLGIKSINYHESKNPMPYNNLYVNITLKFMLICILTKLFISAIRILNGVLAWIDKKFNVEISQICIDTKMLGDCDTIQTIIDKTYYVPCYTRTWDDLAKKTMSNQENGATFAFEGRDTHYGTKYYVKKIFSCIETTLSSENEVVNFDFTNDWINGSLYAPRFLIKSKKNKKTGESTISYCGSQIEDGYDNLYLTQTCSIGNSGETNSPKLDSYTKYTCQDKNRCFKKNTNVNIKRGNINQGIEKNIFYYRAVEFPNNLTNDTVRYIHPTGLILLGSLLDCDQDGIPQLHQLLPSTTFKLPPDSVEKEEDGEFISVLYYNIEYTKELYTVTCWDELTGLTGEDLSSNYLYMTGETTGSIEKIVGTEIEYYGEKGTYYIYANGTFSEVTDNFISYTIDDDGNPIIIKTYSTGTTEVKRIWFPKEGRYVPEISGIDWGNAADNPNSIINYENGLFVGINCVDSETYTKSCVNATRMCELGVDFDEKQIISNGVIETEKKVDGCITEDEISDGDARSMFATLNFYSLQTEKINLIDKYKFNYVYPDGFNGVLVNPLKYSIVNDPVSIDYNKFRFGERYSEKLNHSMFYNSNSITDYFSFPKYENSFYFYFGIKPGYTALEKFNTQYFVPCNETKKNNFNIYPSIVRKESACGSGEGSIKISFKNIIYPCDIYLDNKQVFSKNVDEEVTISNLTSKYYVIRVYDANGESSDSGIFLPKNDNLTYNYEIINPDDNSVHNGEIRIKNINNINSTDNHFSYFISGTTGTVSSSGTILNSGDINGINYTIENLPIGVYYLKVSEKSCEKNYLEISNIRLTSMDSANINSIEVTHATYWDQKYGSIKVIVSGIRRAYDVYTNLYYYTENGRIDNWVKNLSKVSKDVNEFEISRLNCGFYQLCIDYTNEPEEGYVFDPNNLSMKKFKDFNINTPSSKISFKLKSTDNTDISRGTITIYNITNGSSVDKYGYQIFKSEDLMNNIPSFSGNFNGLEYTQVGLNSGIYHVLLFDREVPNINYSDFVSISVRGIPSIEIGDTYNRIDGTTIEIVGSKIIGYSTGIIEKGICYGKESEIINFTDEQGGQLPIIDRDYRVVYNKTEIDPIKKEFDIIINELEPNINYMCRAYAIDENNNIGYSNNLYGGYLTINTMFDEPSVSTLGYEYISIDTGSAIGQIEHMNGNDGIISRGIYFSNIDMTKETYFKMNPDGIIYNYKNEDGAPKSIPIYNDISLLSFDNNDYTVVSETDGVYNFNPDVLRTLNFNCSSTYRFNLYVTRETGENINFETYDNLKKSEACQISIDHPILSNENGNSIIFDLYDFTKLNYKYKIYYPPKSRIGWLVDNIEGNNEKAIFEYSIKLNNRPLITNRDVTFGELSITGVIGDDTMNYPITSVKVTPIDNPKTILEQWEVITKYEDHLVDMNGYTYIDENYVYEPYNIGLIGLLPTRLYSFKSFAIGNYHIGTKGTEYYYERNSIGYGEINTFINLEL